jgi:hypothetical protein
MLLKVNVRMLNKYQDDFIRTNPRDAVQDGADSQHPANLRAGSPFQSDRLFEGNWE